MATPLRRRWYQFGLRAMFVVMTLVAILMAWGASNWRRVQERRIFLHAAGAITGHQRTVQAYNTKRDTRSITWLLFGDERVTFMNLYPNSYNCDYLRRTRSLFPEAEIISSSDVNAEPQFVE